MTRRYQARIWLNGERTTIGRFDTPAERDAAQVAAVAKKYPHGKCVSCNTPAVEGETKCQHHLNQVRTTPFDGSDGDVFDSDAVEYSAWCRLRGYDPVTRTYSGDPAPLARLDGDLLS